MAEVVGVAAERGAVNDYVNHLNLGLWLRLANHSYLALRFI
jgi:hypothetical protein